MKERILIVEDENFDMVMLDLLTLGADDYITKPCESAHHAFAVPDERFA